MKRDKFAMISDNNYLSYGIQLGMTVDACMTIYGHTRFDGLELDARRQCLGRGNTNQHRVISTTKQAI